MRIDENFGTFEVRFAHWIVFLAIGRFENLDSRKGRSNIDGVGVVPRLPMARPGNATSKYTLAY